MHIYTAILHSSYYLYHFAHICVFLDVNLFLFQPFCYICNLGRCYHATPSLAHLHASFATYWMSSKSLNLVINKLTILEMFNLDCSYYRKCHCSRHLHD